MEWNDKGLILAVRKHGETSAIIEVMTQAHGRHMGLVRGGMARAGEVLTFPIPGGEPVEARIVSPVFYDPDGEKQNV